MRTGKLESPFKYPEELIQQWHPSFCVDQGHHVHTRHPCWVWRLRCRERDSAFARTRNSTTSHISRSYLRTFSLYISWTRYVLVYGAEGGLISTSDIDCILPFEHDSTSDCSPSALLPLSPETILFIKTLKSCRWLQRYNWGSDGACSTCKGDTRWRAEIITGEQKEGQGCCCKLYCERQRWVNASSAKCAQYTAHSTYA